MPWVEANLRGQKVFARANEDGSLAAQGGRVEIRYKANDGRAYRALAGNLAVTPGKVLPDDHCGPADAPDDKAQKTTKKAAAAARIPAPREGEWIVYTDGACSGNPGPAGAGFLVIDPVSGERREGFEWLGRATNNVAELTAILRGLEGVPDKAARIRIHTDSSYAIGVLQKGWKAKANPELIATIRAALSEYPHAVLVYVPGHAGVELNERVDVLAREAITRRSSRFLKDGSPKEGG